MTGTAISLRSLADTLADICGRRYVATDEETLFMYGKDQTLNLSFPFDILVKPGTPEEIAAVLKVCNRHKVPVTPRGGGSGVTGGALPARRGVVLSLERLNKIITINTTDAYVVAESGVVTADMCHAVKQAGLYFPVLPTSGSWSFVGGNVAQNAGSINSCKYGTTAQYVLNLEVVLPSGEIVWTGANVTKNATGFNLTSLFAGSEGVLGIITKVVYRLLPLPAHEVVLLAAFQEPEHACRVVAAIKQSAVTPSAVELITENAIKITATYLRAPLPLVKKQIKAHLLIEFQETTEAALDRSMELAAGIIEKFTTEEILTAYTAAEKELLWKLRMNIGYAMTSNNKYYRDIDIVVPLSLLYQYITTVEEICARHQIEVACFGHALDGNLHTMLLANTADPVQEENFRKTAREIYSYALARGGVISGEHGIGLLQQEFMPLQFSAAHLALMQSIKTLFDPNGILNPGKIF